MLLILISVLGIALVAFSVWLVVRIFNRRERWAIRLAVALFVLFGVLYPLSTGPVVWLIGRGPIDSDASETIHIIYGPLQSIYNRGPTWLQEVMDWYVSLWV